MSFKNLTGIEKTPTFCTVFLKLQQQKVLYIPLLFFPYVKTKIQRDYNLYFCREIKHTLFFP